MGQIFLPSNFLSNARGFGFVDSGTVTWAFDKNTNLVSAGAGGGPASGFTGTITTAKLTGGGSNGSMTFVNGVLTSQVAAT